MSDLIDREKTVDTVVEAMMDGADADIVEGLLYLLPSAEPEHKTGKWIPKDDARYYCSSCDGIAPKGLKWNYCPNCGAEMRGEQE